MNNVFEYSDILNSPIEIFSISNTSSVLPVISHWHHFAELIYCKKGTISITYGDTHDELYEGELFIIPPTLMHSFSVANNSEEYEFVGLKFNISKLRLSAGYLPNIIDFFVKVARQKIARFVFNSNEFAGMNIAELFDVFFKELSNKQYGYDVFIYSNLSALITLVLRIWNEEFSFKDIDTDANITGVKAIADVLPYIDANCSQNISISELASMCNMSYSYFAKTFKKYFGKSCKGYIEFIRLSKAENLLLFTDYDLEYIAVETGFTDCSHFIRSFKRQYGTTPKQFRLHNQK